MESQPSCRQRCRMHRVPWRDDIWTGVRGHAGVKRMRHLSLRSGGTTEVRSIQARQDVRELSSSSHLHGAPEGSPGRQVIAVSRRAILELLAGASAHTAVYPILESIFDSRMGFHKSPSLPTVALKTLYSASFLSSAGAFSGVVSGLVIASSRAGVPSTRSSTG